MSEPLRILGLGAGVQSTTVLEMSLAGELPPFDAAIFADTGWEPREVYAHLGRLESRMRAAGLPFHRVSAGDIRADVLATLGQDTCGSSKQPPFFVRGETMEVGMLWRKCTATYKIEPIRRKVREMAEARFGSARLPAGCVLHTFGISWDEVQRTRRSDVAYIAHDYPLVDRRMTRDGCLKWLADRGHPTPPKSACVGCPYHSDAEWRRLKADPEAWADACDFDARIRKGLPGVAGEAFLHRQCVPLPLVDLRPADERRGQLTFGWDNECAGLCGV